MSGFRFDLMVHSIVLLTLKFFLLACDSWTEQIFSLCLSEIILLWLFGEQNKCVDASCEIKYTCGDM